MKKGVTIGGCGRACRMTCGDELSLLSAKNVVGTGGEDSKPAGDTWRRGASIRPVEFRGRRESNKF